MSGRDNPAASLSRDRFELSSIHKFESLILCQPKKLIEEFVQIFCMSAHRRDSLCLRNTVREYVTNIRIILRLRRRVEIWIMVYLIL